MNPNEAVGPVNENITAYKLTKQEGRTVALLLRLTDLDERHAIEFTRIFAYQIRTTPGGADGLIRNRFPKMMKEKNG